MSVSYADIISYYRRACHINVGVKVRDDSDSEKDRDNKSEETLKQNKGGVLIFETVDSIIRILNVYIVSRKETGNE